MTDSITTTADRKRKRRPIVALSLAVLAVGGIGAAATSAAWTDNAFFAAQAQGATFNLQASLDGTANSWKESDSQPGVELTVPASHFANLLPGQSRTVAVFVKNTGSVSAALTGTAAFASGSTFTTDPTIAVSDLAATLTPATGTAASDQFNLTVTTPADWAATNQGKTGNVIVTITGTATAP